MGRSGIIAGIVISAIGVLLLYSGRSVEGNYINGLKVMFGIVVLIGGLVLVCAAIDHTKHHAQFRH